MPLDPNDPTLPPLDFDNLDESVEERLNAGLGRLLSGSAEDIRVYASAIAADLAIATATGDEEALDHLTGQAAMLAEKNRVRGAREVWAQVEAFLYDIGQALILGALADADLPPPVPAEPADSLDADDLLG